MSHFILLYWIWEQSLALAPEPRPRPPERLILRKKGSKAQSPDGATAQGRPEGLRLGSRGRGPARALARWLQRWGLTCTPAPGPASCPFWGPWILPSLLSLPSFLCFYPWSGAGNLLQVHTIPPRTVPLGAPRQAGSLLPTCTPAASPLAWAVQKCLPVPLLSHPG